MEIKKEFTIFRPNWLKGSASANADGCQMYPIGSTSMCCLGQICYQSGADLDDIEDCSDPESVANRQMRNSVVTVPHFLISRESYYHKGSALTHAAIEVNDDVKMSTKRKEAKLTKLFAAEGITLTFSDEVAPWFKDREQEQVPF